MNPYFEVKVKCPNLGRKENYITFYLFQGIEITVLSSNITLICTVTFWGCVTIRRALDWILDLLTTHTLNLLLQAIQHNR
jgi:hypothetical protein